MTPKCWIFLISLSNWSKFDNQIPNMIDRIHQVKRRRGCKSLNAGNGSVPWHPKGINISGSQITQKLRFDGRSSARKLTKTIWYHWNVIKIIHIQWKYWNYCNLTREGAKRLPRSNSKYFMIFIKNEYFYHISMMPNCFC